MEGAVKANPAEDESGPAFKGAFASLVSNLALLISIAIAFSYANSLEMVSTAPTRYSGIVIPITIGAIFASIISFLFYLDLPKLWKVVPFTGAVLAGWALAQIFFPFMGPVNEWSEWPAGKIDTVVPEYLNRIGQIGLFIFLFSNFTFGSSLVKAWEQRDSGRDNSIRASRNYWLLKAFVCDLPIVIGAGVILILQGFYQDSAHLNYTEVYYKLFHEPSGERVLASPEYFAAADSQRVLTNANFWLGVALGVTSAQLVLQQISTLMLEILLIFRKKLR